MFTTYFVVFVVSYRIRIGIFKKDWTPDNITIEAKTRLRAMKMNMKIWIMSGLLMMLVMASGIATAQPAGDDTLRGFINVDKVGTSDTGTELKVGLIAVGKLYTSSGQEAKEVYDWVEDQCAGQPDREQCIAEKFAEISVDAEEYAIEPESVEGAVFSVSYFNSITSSYVTVTGCEAIPADSSEELEYYDNTIQYYYTTCTVPKSVYEGKATNVRVSLVEAENVYAPPVTVEVKDDVGPSPAGAFSIALSELVDSLMSGETGEATFGGTALPCIGVFIILGLLLASMYFSGKSPITLLDVTTPRLPAPKGLAAGGQVMLPYGYGELKKGINRKLGASAAALSASKKAAGKKKGYDPEMEKAKEKIKDAKKKGKYAGTVLEGEKSEEMMENVASLGREAGLTADEMNPLFQKPMAMWGDKEHKIVASIMDKLAAKGGESALKAATLKDYMLSMRTMQTMDALSGHPSATSRGAIHTKIAGKIGKYTGTGRYPLLGVTTSGSYDSIIRSGKVAARGTKAMVEHAPDMARAVARTTMSMVGGERAMEKLERSRPSAAAWLKKPSKAVDIGHMFPVGDKMNHLYETLSKEVVNDEIKFTLMQLYKKMGVNFAITEEELVQMGYKDMNILEASGYNSKKVQEMLKNIEPEMLAILSSKELSSVDKRDKLMALAMEHGALSQEAVSQMKQFNAELEAIAESGQPGYNKFLQLQEMLLEHEKHVPSAKSGQVLDTDQFYTVVGRQTLAGSDLWSTAVLRNLIHDAENGHLNGGGLKEELQISWLKTVNRMVSLRPTSNMEELPQFMRNKAELQAIEKRVESTIKELLTADGKEALKKFTGKNVENAKIADLEKVLYGGRSMAPTGEIDKEGRVAKWGDEKELGPLSGTFRGDMKELWLTELKTSESLALGMYTEGRFKRGYFVELPADVEAKIDRMPGSAGWSVEERTRVAKEELAKHYMRDDLENRFNSVYSPNAYGNTRETSAFYAGIAAGFLEKALTEKGVASNHPDLVTAQSLDVSSPSQLKKLQGLLSKHKEAFEEVMKRPVTYDDVANSKQAMVMLYEGGFAFAHKGMPLSSSDRVYGTVTIRDQNGRKKEFAPEDVVVSLPDHLQEGLYKVRDSKDPKDWSAFMDSVVKWSKEGGYNYEREKILAATVWEYGNNTNDYQKYYQKTSMEITSKREATPLAPDALRMFGAEGGKFREALKPFRDISHDIGNYVGKVALVAGGPVFRGSYDITPTSEYLRQHSWQLAANIYTKDWKNLTPVEKQAYEKAGAAHFEYHNVWDWAIDRNPMRHSTSHGLQSSTEGYFHYGPREVAASKDYIRANMTKAQWNTFKYGPYGALADVASKLHSIPAGMFGGMQMAMQGYPSKWDKTENPLKPWDYTPTRFLEAGRALNPFSFEWTNKLGKYVGKANVWEGSLEKRQLAGPDLMGGLAAGPQDTYFKRTGVYSAVRLGEANPGASYYNFRHELKYDPAMAEWLVRNKDSVYMYDKTVKDQAYTNTTRRTVSAEALGMRRSQELRQFGVMQNSLYGWFNPVLFAWHMPLPFLPPSMSPREMFQRAAQKAKYGGGRKWSASVKDMFQSTGQKVSMAAQPWKGHLVAYCRRCGKPGYKGSRCMCGGTIYGA